MSSSSSTRVGVQQEEVGWTYDSAGAGEFWLGRLARMSDPSCSTSYRYERRGLLRSEQQTIMGSAYTTSYEYDGEGNRTRARAATLRSDR